MSKDSKFAILVVDDDPKVRELIQNFFIMRSEEIICVMAEDAQQALLKLSNQEFDIVLIDNILGDRSGIDFGLSLRKSLKYASIPIIVMSGALKQNDVLRAMEGGLKDILVKPFSLKQLSDKINFCLRRGN